MADPRYDPFAPDFKGWSPFSEDSALGRVWDAIPTPWSLHNNIQDYVNPERRQPALPPPDEYIPPGSRNEYGGEQLGPQALGIYDRPRSQYQGDVVIRPAPMPIPQPETPSIPRPSTNPSTRDYDTSRAMRSERDYYERVPPPPIENAPVGGPLRPSPVQEKVPPGGPLTNVSYVPVDYEPDFVDQPPQKIARYEAVNFNPFSEDEDPSLAMERQFQEFDKRIEGGEFDRRQAAWEEWRNRAPGEQEEVAQQFQYFPGQYKEPVLPKVILPGPSYGEGEMMPTPKSWDPRLNALEDEHFGNFIYNRDVGREDELQNSILRGEQGYYGSTPEEALDIYRFGRPITHRSALPPPYGR